MRTLVGIFLLYAYYILGVPYLGFPVESLYLGCGVLDIGPTYSSILSDSATKTYSTGPSGVRRSEYKTLLYFE